MSLLGTLVQRVLDYWILKRDLLQQDNWQATDCSSQEQEARYFLHVGCGSARKPDVAAIFRADDWREIRLDIDPTVSPDVIGSMTDMSAVPAGTMDGVYSSHNIEHLLPHEVSVALGEFWRVLDSEGILVLTCPDLQSVCAMVAQGKLEEALYESSAGPIAAHDILYGLRTSLAAGNLYMAHRTGFTMESLVAALRSAGFLTIVSLRDEASYSLWAVATKQQLSDVAALELADRCFKA